MTIEQSVDELDQGGFDAAADWARLQLAALGHAFIDLQPGDGTTYKIVIVRPTRVSLRQPTINQLASMWVGTSFGPLYPWRGDWHVHWTYVSDHWLPEKKCSQEWTARVLARFLNALCDQLKET